MAGALRGLGAVVFDLDVECFVARNERQIENAIAALKSFRADVAISLPNAGYALLCATLEQKNVFSEILGIPTVMLWDHGLLQFPKLILEPLPKRPVEAMAGSIQRLRDSLDHPCYAHYSPDRGHIAALDKLGVIDGSKVNFFLQPAYPNFIRYGASAPPSGAFRTRVAFAGNVYLEASRNLAFRNRKILAEIEARVLTAKRKRLTECLWDLIMAEIRALDSSTRYRLRLNPDSTFFWRFLHDEIELVGNTEVRLSVLGGLKHQYDFFGNFVEPGAVSTLRDRHRIRFRKSLDYFTELPLLFMNSSVIVDIINLGYNSGISPKVMGCMACGGLVLFDYKEDFYQSMGDIADEVTYRSVDHLNSLVDMYLGDSRKRRRVSRELQDRVSTEFSFSALAQRILVDEPVWRSVALSVSTS